MSLISSKRYINGETAPEWVFQRAAAGLRVRVRIRISTATRAAVGAMLVVAASAAPIQAQDDPRVAEFNRAMAEFDQATNLRAHAPDRAAQLYASCAQRLESLRARGVASGALEFDLGNVYLQMSDVGRAILHYRRAQRLIPRDPNLAYNLDVARHRCLTYVPPTRGRRVLQSALFWHYGTSTGARARVAIAAYVLLFALLTVRAFHRRRAWVYLAIACGVVAVSAGGSVAADEYARRHAPEGVILEPDVTVRRGPGTGYDRQFEQPLQAGAEFTLRQRRGAWWRVELPDGQGGWLPARTAELIGDGATG